MYEFIPSFFAYEHNLMVVFIMLCVIIIFEYILFKEV